MPRPRLSSFSWQCSKCVANSTNDINGNLPLMGRQSCEFHCTLEPIGDVYWLCLVQHKEGQLQQILVLWSAIYVMDQTAEKRK